ncbi:MAG TPA: hypothetical protein PLL23_11960 [Chitinophagaceae bacterium]|nr:hypothetical protein [Chitinophagaceae bacterium]
MRVFLTFGTALVLLLKVTVFSSVYDFSIAGISGETRQLSTYNQKKLLIVTLPTVINEDNSTKLLKLDSLAKARKPDLSIVAVPSFEDGFTVLNKEQLKSWYQGHLDSSVFIADGSYTRKTSLDNQHPLFKWLTKSEQNGNFDLDVQNPFDKFFINSEGQLVAVLGAYIPFSSTSINKVLSMN